MYLKYVDQMIKANQAYPCFCSDEELDEMRRDAELNNRPPVYNGAPIFSSWLPLQPDLSVAPSLDRLYLPALLGRGPGGCRGLQRVAAVPPQ